MNCHCGKPLHYQDPKVQEAVEALIRALGECMPVTVGNRTWLVPRHYIALHGLCGIELPFLGFRELTRPPKKVL